MEIIEDYPPNWTELEKAFPDAARGKSILITFGGKLYNPFKIPLRDDLIAHEEVHAQQQEKFKGKPEEWTHNYIHDQIFRYKVEVEAYGKQCKFLKEKYGRKRFREACIYYARALAGPVYATITTGKLCSFEYALNNIKKIAEK